MPIFQDKQNRLLGTPWCITILIMPSRCCIRTLPNRLEIYTSKHLVNVDALGSAVNLQIFYLLDEAVGKSVGKGENSVVTMVHHHFTHLAYGEESNAPYGQLRRAKLKQHRDWVKWRASNAETLEEVADTVRKSSRGGYNIPQLVKDPAKPVTLYNWTEFLRTLFKSIPGLNKYHHFRITSSHPGTVFVREYDGNQEVVIEITRPQRQPIPSSDMPERIDIQELDAKRSWYLFEEIAPLCNYSAACAKPTVPNPSSGVRL